MRWTVLFKASNKRLRVHLVMAEVRAFALATHLFVRFRRLLS
jgi:hypothetical protein